MSLNTWTLLTNQYRYLHSQDLKNYPSESFQIKIQISYSEIIGTKSYTGIHLWSKQPIASNRQANASKGPRKMILSLNIILFIHSAWTELSSFFQFNFSYFYVSSYLCCPTLPLIIIITLTYIHELDERWTTKIIKIYMYIYVCNDSWEYGYFP